MSPPWGHLRHLLDQNHQRNHQRKNTPTPKGVGKNGHIPTTPIALRLTKLFHRRPNRPWTDEEYRAYQNAGEITESDLDIIETYYERERAKGQDGIQRRDLLRLLRHFPGELDKAIGVQRRRKTFQQEAIPDWVMMGITEEEWRNKYEQKR